MRLDVARKKIKHGELRPDEVIVRQCSLCDGHGMDEFPADRWADYRYLPCVACNGLGRVAVVKE